MIRSLRHLFGLARTPPHRPTWLSEDDIRNGSETEDLPPPIYGSMNGPYFGKLVPLEASREPGACTWYDDFYEQLSVAPHANGTAVIVFPKTVHGENAVTGKVRWTGTRDDDDWGRERMQTSVQIYEHLATVADDWNEGVVKYFRKINSGLNLDRLALGPMPLSWPPINGDDRILALYQRWTLQVLSELIFFHRDGVVLNDLSASSLRLRADFSVAVGRIANAGNAKLWVRGELLGDGRTLGNQWGPASQYSDPPAPPRDPEGEAGR